MSLRSRNHKVPRIVFPSSHGSENRVSSSTRPPIVQNISSNSASSSLSASTAATSVSASSIEIKVGIEEAMTTALFGNGGRRKSPTHSITSLPLTSTHPAPWNDDELLSNIRERTPPSLPPRRAAPTKRNPKMRLIVRFSLGSNAWETDSEVEGEDGEILARTVSREWRDESVTKERDERTKKGKGRGDKTKFGEVEEIEYVEVSPELDVRTERLMNIRFQRGERKGNGCGLGVEGLKGMQGMRGPHHKGEYFEGMRGVEQ